RAYTSDRFPSFTQRSQFAQFQLGWVPEGEVSYRNPGDLYRELDEKKIKSHDQAVDALNRLLPGFLDGWGCRNENVFLRRKAQNFSCRLPGEKQ
ncbi:MAG: hypothetical protein PHI35_04420, partial [Victivallaceae bacterium]|nr:hypothetical protein [Victivallaceae bacterium]